MTTTVEAIYEQGMPRFIQPLPSVLRLDAPAHFAVVIWLGLSSDLGR